MGFDRYLTVKVPTFNFVAFFAGDPGRQDRHEPYEYSVSTELREPEKNVTE